MHLVGPIILIYYNIHTISANSVSLTVVFHQVLKHILRSTSRIYSVLKQNTVCLHANH
jgi:hypothetical protein